MDFQKILRNVIFPVCIFIAWYAMASYTFNEKIDLNGDNIYYYTTASSMASGHGYSDLSVLGTPSTATYPPGYPLLMTPLRFFTDSIVAQKWQNQIFILISILLLYFSMLRVGISVSISFVSAFACAFIPRLLHFSTMMMSESSFCLTGVLALYFMIKASEDETKWYSELRHPWIYLALVALVFNYYCRTQGLALLAAMLFCFLIRRRWASLALIAGGFVLGYLPWTLRNKALGLSNTRYLDMVMVANPWRPEEGALTVPEFISRFFETLQMLVFSAIPGAVMPFASTNPDQPEYSVGLYVIGFLMIVIIAIGCWQMKQIRWAMIGYIGATLGIISIFSTPSGNRYLTSILPLLTVGVFVGLATIALWAVEKLFHNTLRWSETVIALCLGMCILLARPGIVEEHEMSNQPFPIQYKQFFEMGKLLKKHTPKNTVICSRKSQMLWLYANRPGCGYLYTSDDKKLILDLVAKKVDYVIIDALGYSSTSLYLVPAIQKNMQYFGIVSHFENTQTYLCKFDRERAAAELQP